MVFESQIECGFRDAGGVLVRKGRNELVIRDLPRNEREFVEALIEGKLITVIEPDAPPEGAQVIPIRDAVQGKPPKAEEAAPAKSIRRRRRRA